VAITPEHYNRMYRILTRGIPVKVEVEVRNRVGETAEQAMNLVGEIAGSDLKDEVVMIGAHLDTWHASPNASDNTSGVAVVLEAARILKAVGAKIDHYVKKGDRRKAKFAKLYEQIVSRAAESGTPPAFKNCKEASELAYHFFNMLKTLWKLEQHIMFLQVFAQGIACSLKEAATAARPPLQGTSTIPDGPAYFPHEAATGLDQWFHFWRQVPLPQPPAAPAATTPNSPQDPSSSVLSTSGDESSSSSVLSTNGDESSSSSVLSTNEDESAASSVLSSDDEPASSIEELPDSDESASHGWSDDEPDDQPRR
jgi:hypothetical protein